jgi:hypothetical protein
VNYHDVRELDASAVGLFNAYPVGGLARARIQAVPVGTNWTSAIVHIRWRNDASMPWSDFASAITLTASAPATTTVVDIYGVMELGAVVTTAEANVKLSVAVWAEYLKPE